MKLFCLNELVLLMNLYVHPFYRTGLVDLTGDIFRWHMQYYPEVAYLFHPKGGRHLSVVGDLHAVRNVLDQDELKIVDFVVTKG
ncbi:hypothetical protein A2686_01965 [Candidatus Woesebacteria bacterium RIFCSPHIGHO2_01_FULL_38_10]|nr:MAG: hypothetical protein A2686_01965 [Candidatus Woesebacteria bacterium RIFCSPHIGHO2_01_FULL_38_10]